VGGQRHAPAALPPGRTRYSLYIRMGWQQGRYGRVREILPLPGLDPRTVQPVASRYTDWAISVHLCTCILFLLFKTRDVFYQNWQFRALVIHAVSLSVGDSVTCP
jgi:hypothetical protein